MELRSLNVYFFFLLFLLVGIIVFMVFQPFLTAMIVAAILATIFRGSYKKIVRLVRSEIGAALLTCFFVILILVTPIFVIMSLAIKEANSLYQKYGQEQELGTIVDDTVKRAEELPFVGGLFNTEILKRERLLQDLGRFGENAIGFLSAAYKGVTHFVFWIFVMFFTLFYFLIDGDRMIKKLMRLSPLRDRHDKLLMQKFTSISRATLKGSLVIGVIQGFLGGLTFWIADVPAPAIWGLIMVIFALVPMVGTAIVWVPAGIIMFALGFTWQGLFILAVGAGIISLIDNILRPKLIGQDTRMHPLLVFFATIGGISLFGLPGFIIGPIIVALFLALSEIYTIEFGSQLKEYNA